MKKHLFIIPLACLSMFGLTVNSSIQVKAEDEVVEEIPIEEDDPATETTDYEAEIERLKQEWQTKLNEFKDNYVVPLVSGVSVATIINLILTLAYTLIKNKTIKLKDKIIDDNQVRMSDMVEAQKIFCDKVANMIQELQQSNSINKETLAAVQSSANDLFVKIADLTGKTEHMTKIIPVLNTVAIIQSKTVEASEVAIKSGVADDVNKLLEQLKDLNSED